MKRYVTSLGIGAIALVLSLTGAPALQADGLSIMTVASTIPSNGDVNPCLLYTSRCV